MFNNARRLAVTALALTLLIAASGCHYDYGYYSVGYGYGYDCAPRYHSSWDCDYYYSSSYYAPCDGVRYSTFRSYGHGHRYYKPCP